MNFRVIYVVEGLDLRVDSEPCVARRYARNLKTARKIAAQMERRFKMEHRSVFARIGVVGKNARRLVNPEWVEG